MTNPNVPSDYTSGLPIGTMNDLLGFLESVEGFGGGQVYLDTATPPNPTIGYAFLLYDVQSRTVGTQALNAVLDQIQNGAGQHVFAASSMSAQTIVTYFSSVLRVYGAGPLSTLISILAWGISDLFAGQVLTPNQVPPSTLQEPACRARQAIEFPHHQGVAGAHEVERGCASLPAFQAKVVAPFNDQ